jgi:Gluconate 2-dehydrogenase subunit 3
MDRRITIKWMLAVAAATQGIRDPVRALGTAGDPVAAAGRGYGTDPNLTRTYQLGDLWPLTFTPQQRSTAKVLCDLIIPGDASSPNASDVGVVEFIDEWISAPYEQQRRDRAAVLEGLEWLDREAAGRHGAGKSFVTLSDVQQTAICDDICFLGKAQPRFLDAAKFFARYRDLTAGGFYTTPQGRKDLRYVGNVPLPRFDGPPLEVLKKVGLA